MRLRNIYILCKQNVASIKNLSGTSYQNSRENGITVSSWNTALKGIENVRKIAYLSETCDHLIGAVPQVFITLDTYRVTNDSWSAMSKYKNELVTRMNDVISLYESMGYGDDNSQRDNNAELDIYIPPLHSFSEYKDIVNEIDYIINKCPLFTTVKDEHFVFGGTDIGSTWLALVITGATAVVPILLTNVVAFMDKLIIYKSHKLTLEQQKHDLEVSEENCESKKTILKYLEDQYKKQIDILYQEVQEIAKEPDPTPESKDQMERCFDKGMQLMDMGVKIYTAIDAPQEAKDLFAPIEQKYLSIDDVKKLVDKSSSAQGTDE